MPQLGRVDLNALRNALYLLDRAVQDYDQRYPYAAGTDDAGRQQREHKARLIRLREQLLTHATNGIEAMLDEWQAAALQEP